ncbi:hypothetical protein WICPIJ_004939, partial [Wickerhamomyces pijperi]
IKALDSSSFQIEITQDKPHNQDPKENSSMSLLLPSSRPNVWRLSLIRSSLKPQILSYSFRQTTRAFSLHSNTTTKVTRTSSIDTVRFPTGATLFKRPALLSYLSARSISTQGNNDSGKGSSSSSNDNQQQPRPTKEHYLSQATSFTEKLAIRMKWLLKRNMKPFNADDFSAFFSWIVLGNIMLIVLGTTTFASLFIFLLNTVFAQEYIAAKLGNFITKNSNLTVVFESAIVPDWRDGKISFNKCFVSKRPKNKKRNVFEKGLQAEAIAEAIQNIEGEDTEVFDDGNYTQFDLTIDQVNVSLSFSKFFNGRGILGEVEVHGMRGIVDRTHVVWDPDDDARNYKNIKAPGDYEIDNFKMTDVLLTLAQPDGFRPFNVSVFNCELPVLRKNWLFYDFLNANNISGSYDDSLFTIHKRQAKTDFQADGFQGSSSSNSKGSVWKRITRCRVDALNIDHMNRGLEGPFGWINSGTVDMIGDIMVPEDEDISLGEILQTMTASLAKETRLFQRSKKEAELGNNASAISETQKMKYTLKNDVATKYFIMDLQMKLNNPKASVPLFTPSLSYVNYALVRPIVGYINSRKTYIPISCRIVKKIEDFDGSWTMYDSTLMDDMSVEVYDAFAEYVKDEEVRLVQQSLLEAPHVAIPTYHNNVSDDQRPDDFRKRVDGVDDCLHDPRLVENVHYFGMEQGLWSGESLVVQLQDLLALRLVLLLEFRRKHVALRGGVEVGKDILNDVVLLVGALRLDLLERLVVVQRHKAGLVLDVVDEHGLVCDVVVPERDLLS